MQRFKIPIFALILVVAAGCEKSIRFASYNASLSREKAGLLLYNLSFTTDPQAKAVADLIQKQMPDVLLLSDIDYDGADRVRYRFRGDYLTLSQAGGVPIDYPNHFTGPVNTGVASGFDLNHDGKAITTPGSLQYAEDAIGFGEFPGQHGMMLLSKFPIDTKNIRTFTRFKWKNMPDAQLPTDASGKPYYDEAELKMLRLQTTDLWDVPIRIGDQTVHVLVNRPTKVEADGPEHRKAKRNHDEIRFLCDYLSGAGTDRGPAAYITDDENGKGGFDVTGGTHFVIMGEETSDSMDALLKHPRVMAGPSGRPEVLVSRGMKIVGGNVISPPPATQPVMGSTADQHFVYLDVKF
jgi:3-phytase